MAWNDGVLLTPPEHHWHCPACDRTAVTHEKRPHSQLHPCPGVGGLLAPYAPVPPGQDRARGKLTAIVREDYEAHAGRVGGAETLRRDESGRPITRVTAEYDGGAAHALFVPGINIEMRGGGA